MKKENSRLEYYNSNAESYVNATLDADVSDAFKRFVTMLPSGGHILDVGCGSGRDTLAFLNAGFKVTAFDASEELARLASERTNSSVLTMKIQDLQFKDRFDGVWAMASLLHLPKNELIDAITNCVTALKWDSSGILYATFKMGIGESVDSKGRFFSYYQPEELRNVFESTNRFSSVKIIVVKDSLGREELDWINIVAEKKPMLIDVDKDKMKVRR